MENDIFILPASINGKVLLYSPLRMKATLIDNNDDTINQVLSSWSNIKVHYPDNDKDHINPNHVIILLTNSCNLSCSYCYSRFSRSKQTMDYGTLITVINYVLSNSTSNTKYFSFSGGGEPLMAWDLLSEGIAYIRSNSKRESTKISIVTNGVLLSEKRIEYLKQMDVKINISFDILPEIQNNQRKTTIGNRSYELTSRNIRIMNSYKMPVAFHTTITRDSVHQISDMVMWTKNEFPFVKNINIWPAIDPKEKLIDFYNDYSVNFIKASEIAWNFGIRLHNWLTVMDRFHSRFCQEDFCVTPNGEIVTCLRSTSKNDPNYDIFHIGSVANSINIVSDMERRAMSMLNSKYEECCSCPAKWSCAGICPYTRLLLDNYKIRDYCDFTRNFMGQYIEFCIKYDLLLTK